MELSIEEWEWDDANIAHLDAHGVTPEMIEDEVWAGEPRFIANRHNRSASHLMIGPDSAGRLWTVCTPGRRALWRMARDHRVAKPIARSGRVLEGALTMTKQHDDDEDVARQLERDADDDAVWEQEPVKIERRPSRTSVLSLRLPTTEFHALLRAARQSGESVSDFARGALAARMVTRSATTLITVTGADFSLSEDAAPPTWRTVTTGQAQQGNEGAARSSR